MKRTDNRTVTIWNLAHSGKLSIDEKAVADKLKNTATTLFVNYESMRAVMKNGKFTPDESLAVKQLGDVLSYDFSSCFSSSLAANGSPPVAADWPANHDIGQMSTKTKSITDRPSTPIS